MPPRVENAEFPIFQSKLIHNIPQELNKRQQQLEQAHAMLLRHHEKTQELEYRQQRAVHSLREDQVQRQHATELCNQQDYMQRAERDLRKKHALELKQQPKSLKVSRLFCPSNKCTYLQKFFFSLMTNIMI